MESCHPTTSFSSALLWPCFICGLQLGARLPAGHHYLDYTASSVYTNSQLAAVFEELRTTMFGNPHSASASSMLSSDRLEDVSGHAWTAHLVVYRGACMHACVQGADTIEAWAESQRARQAGRQRPRGAADEHIKAHGPCGTVACMHACMGRSETPGEGGGGGAPCALALGGASLPTNTPPPPALGVCARVQARALVLRWFNADPTEYQVVFTRSATGAIKMVGETFPWTKGSAFRCVHRRAPPCMHACM